MTIARHPGHWLFGNLHQFQRSPYGFPAQAADDHGGMARIRVLHHQFIAVNNPDVYHHVMIKNHANYERSYHYTTQHLLIGPGLLSTDGALWQKKRERANPAFASPMLAGFIPLSVNVTERGLTRWDASARDGQPVLVMNEMQRLTISVICQSLFSVDIDEEHVFSFCENVRHASGLIRRKNNSVLPRPSWWPSKLDQELARVEREMRAFVMDKLERRAELLRRGQKKAPDILDTLLGGQDLRDLSPEAFEDLIAECKNFLLAGFETTAISLAWALIELASHPRVAAKWHAECDAVLGAWPNDRSTYGALSPSDLKSLRYSRQILMEAMRLYPAVYTQPRVALSDDTIQGHKIRRGDILLLSVYGMHRSPTHWEDPLEFIPERFDEGQDWPKKSYMPFSKGKHTCIGNHFSTNEMLIILSMIGQRFELELVNKAKVGTKALLVLVPDRDVYLRLKRRSLT